MFISHFYEQKKKVLIEGILAAFDGVSRENGVSLSESCVIDDYGSDEERTEARKRDTETRWQDVPDQDICEGHSCLSFLDEIGFRYYLPAYLVWYLRNMDNDDPENPSYESMTFGSLQFALGVGNSELLSEFRLSRYRLLTLEQSTAVAHFLQFCEEVAIEDNMKSEQWWQDMVSNEKFSQEEIETERQREMKIRLASDLPESEFRQALEKYWGRFL